MSKLLLEKRKGQEVLKGRAKRQVNKVAQKLRKASKAHANQAKTLAKLTKSGSKRRKR